MRRALLAFLALSLAPLPGASTRTVTLAPDGSGDYPTLAAAVAAAPRLPEQPGAARWLLRLRPGVYHERLILPRGLAPLELQGESAATTTIAFDLHANSPDPDAPGKALGTFRTPTVFIEADDVACAGLSFANTAGPVGQALALRADGDRLVFRRCRLIGWQDTLLANKGRHYFENCYIEGHVDFIFGSSTAYFSRCEIHALRGGYLTAASTPQGQAHGFVFANCRVTAEPGIAGKVYLGRPWRPYARTVFLHTQLCDAVRPEGWHNWSKPEAERTAFYAEFASSGPGAASASRAPWSRQLTESEAASLTPAAVLAGADAWHPDSP